MSMSFGTLFATGAVKGAEQATTVGADMAQQAAGATGKPAEVPPDIAQALFDEMQALVVKHFHFHPEAATALIVVLGTIGLVVLATLANWIVRIVAIRIVTVLARKSPVNWVDVLSSTHVFRRVSHFAAAFIYTRLGYFVYCRTPPLWKFVETAISVYLVVVIVVIIDSVARALHNVSVRTGSGTGLPLKGIAQAVRMAIYFIGVIQILSILLDKSPIYFLSGLGALSAVLLLVFKDALLGFVAGIMLASNRMVVVGDWIEMPKAGADGEVLDVSLTTVKVRNWDMTIVTLPSYSLISESFKNWRGMSESGGRRIKRSINIDVQSIGFADAEMIARWQKIDLLKKYLGKKLEELSLDNDGTSAAEHIANRRHLTNIGTFRAYCLEYLKAIPQVRQDMTIIVRQLDPTEFGIPMELYFFSRDTNWVAYENLQSDIFDHLLAVIGEFGLSVYQRPSGNDQRSFVKSLQENNPTGA